MSYSINKLEKKDWPPLLGEINDPPKNLMLAGKKPDWSEYKILTVIGSRKYTSYGKFALSKLIDGLIGQKIIIVSGLAIGIDSLAHQKALENNLLTIAIPGSGLDEKVIYPKTNLYLARKIIESGGALLSEFENDFNATPYSFPQRNRIMAGMSDAVLVIEAEEKSGTLITARLAREYNREVLVVPGPINSMTSVGANRLIKDGATPVLESKDILEALNIKEGGTRKELDFSNFSDSELKILEALREPLEKEELVRMLEMEATEINVTLSLMEIKGVIKEEMGKICRNL